MLILGLKFNKTELVLYVILLGIAVGLSKKTNLSDEVIFGVSCLLVPVIRRFFSNRPGKVCTPLVIAQGTSEYVFSAERECTTVSNCAPGYVLKNGSCIKIGDACVSSNTTVEHSNAFAYNAKGECELTKCDAGWVPEAGTCVSVTGKTCTTAAPVENSSAFKYSDAGVCTLDSCITGYTAKSGVCTKDLETVAAGVACTLPNGGVIEGATGYITDAAGNCTLVLGCDAGFEILPDKTRCMRMFSSTLNSLVTQSDAAYAVFIEKKNALIAAAPAARAEMFKTRGELDKIMDKVVDLYINRYILETRVPPVNPAVEVTITNSEILSVHENIKSMINDGSSNTEGYPLYITRLVSDLREILPMRTQPQ